MFTTVTCCEEIGKKPFKHRTEVCERAYFGICVRITASESLLSKFQDLVLRFPRRSGSWKFYKHNSRTFQEALEPQTKLGLLYCRNIVPEADGVSAGAGG